MKAGGFRLKLAGFSLVEVTLAIGVISFALLAVVALIPVGLKAVKNSAEQATGAAVLASISEALRHSSSEDGTNFDVVFSGTNTFVKGGSPPSTWTWENLSLEGTESLNDRRIVACLNILETPSADGLKPGRAVASVAWSATGNPQFDPATQKWSQAEGSLSAPILFLPTARP